MRTSICEKATSVRVVIDDRSRLVVERAQSLLKRLRVVVRALGQRFSGDLEFNNDDTRGFKIQVAYVVTHRNLRRIEDGMV